MKTEITRACPFCGAAGEQLQVLHDLGDFTSGAAVCCDSCGAIGPSDDSSARAVALWNGAALQALGKGVPA
ncbi:Lar family restriction alleviation protein [Thauera butanivorans]|uniref:Lar family restriction alleviation protein n=1 Tax=Thauera butanivorans TaxID=86174 RepID=UPI00083989B2|nr:Lar family restriction alleviation protein [Thauera butanivorans]